MPRRSTGCEKCRQRKVRCDERKPACQRCTDYGINCPGYRPPASRDFHFVDQSEYGARRAGLDPETASSGRPSEASTTLTVRRAAPVQRLRWRNVYSGPIAAVEAISGEINHSHLHRAQLLSVFLDLYLPKKRDNKTMSHFAYIIALPDLDLSMPLLQISVDTLCLVELGSLYRDSTMLQEARSRYVRALPMLARVLYRPRDKRASQDQILAAITILSLCELFDAIAQGTNGGQGWISHVQGAQQYLKNLGPSVVDSSLGWLVFNNIRHASLCMALTKRQSSFLADPMWLQLSIQNNVSRDPQILLYDLCLQAPGLLELADGLSSSMSFENDFSKLCLGICRLREELSTWLATNAAGNKQQISIIDLRDMLEFSAACADRTFVTVYSFTSVQTCSQYQLYWIICLLLDFTLANVYRVHSKSHELPPLSDYTIRSRAEIWQEMYVNATNYCRTVPFCCEPEIASTGRNGTFLLRVVQSYFDICAHRRELRWCRAVRAMLENKGTSTLRVDPTTTNLSSPELSNQGAMTLDGHYPYRGYTPRLPLASIERPPSLTFSLASASSPSLNPSTVTSPLATSSVSICPSYQPYRSGIKLPSSPPAEIYAVMSDGPFNETQGKQFTILPPRSRYSVHSHIIRGTEEPHYCPYRPDGSLITILPRQNGASAMADERQSKPMWKIDGAPLSIDDLTDSLVNDDWVSDSSGHPRRNHESGESILDTQTDIVEWRVSSDEASNEALTQGRFPELMGSSGDVQLLPDGQARTGAVGAMCF